MNKNNHFSARKAILLCSQLVLMMLLFSVTDVTAAQTGKYSSKKINKLLYKMGSCSLTTQVTYKACKNESADDYWIGVGICANLSDKPLRNECLKVIREEYDEALELCELQQEARDEICEYLGEAPYDPVLNPEDFLDPDEIDSSNSNPLWPLVVGTQWVYEGQTEDGLETITVTVTDKIKEIEYPEDSGQIFLCREVRDIVEIEGTVVEDTRDWYAQDQAGNIWYFGEIAQNYEDGELVDVEGSWKAGDSGAKPGIVMFASPSVEAMYRQEFLLGEAEDMALIKSINEVTVDTVAGSFTEGVLQTVEWTPIEPEVMEYKYYAPGFGMVLEEDPETGETIELVEIHLP